MFVTIAAALLAVACAATGDDGADGASELKVVVTTNILGDLVSDVVGDAGEVEVLMQPGQDPHGFALSAQQAASLRDADLVVANGLGLEESMVDALESAEEDGVVVVRVGELLDPLRFEGEHDHGDDDEEHDEEEDDHEDESFDPHVWLDPIRMAEAPIVIADRLAELDDVRPDEEWQNRANEVAGRILAAHEDVEQRLKAVPGDCRKLVTNHDSLGYFAARYDFEVVGTVIPGSSTQAQPSAQGFAELAAKIREAGVPAIFTETTQSRRLADALADELGREIQVVDLHTGSLGTEDSGAATYPDLLRTNAQRIADALTGC